MLAALETITPDSNNGIQAAKNPHEDVTGETVTATGRLKEAKNYSPHELKVLLSCVREVMPIGPARFAMVADLYNHIAKDKGLAERSGGPLCQRWEKVNIIHSYLPC